MSKKHRPTVKHVDQRKYVVTFPNGDVNNLPDDMSDDALDEAVFEGKTCAAILRFRKAEEKSA